VQYAQVVIYDINGKLVLDQKIQTLNSEQDYKLRMPDNLPKGAYIVKLGLMDKQYTGKVLID
jgi:methionine-rich copper-binding protein CopC